MQASPFPSRPKGEGASRCPFPLCFACREASACPAAWRVLRASAAPEQGASFCPRTPLAQLWSVQPPHLFEVCSCAIDTTEKRSVSAPCQGPVRMAFAFPWFLPDKPRSLVSMTLGQPCASCVCLCCSISWSEKLGHRSGCCSWAVLVPCPHAGSEGLE